MNVADLPQYAIDDIALEYSSEPPPPASAIPQPLIVVGNVQMCVTPPNSAPVCIPANRYTVTVPESQRTQAQAYVNGKAQAELNGPLTHVGTFTYSNLITYNGFLLFNTPPVQTHLAVSGLVGVVTKVIMTMNPMQHNNCGEAVLMLLLQSASGQVAEIMWQCGTTSPRVDAMNLTIDDTGPAMPTDLSTGMLTGTYKPSSRNNAVNINPPGPQGPYTVALSALNGTNPNGSWILWGLNKGGIPGETLTLPNGFSLQITTV